MKIVKDNGKTSWRVGIAAKLVVLYEHHKICSNDFEENPGYTIRYGALIIGTFFVSIGKLFASMGSILIIVQREATQSSLFIIILQVHCTCFGCQPHPSSGVQKTVTTASDTVQLPPSNVARLDHVGGRSLHSTGGCSYSFVYSWWWVWLTPKTCRQNFQNNK